MVGLDDEEAYLDGSAAGATHMHLVPPQGAGEAEVTRLEQALTRWRSEGNAKRVELAALQALAGAASARDDLSGESRLLALDAQDLQIQIDGADAAVAMAAKQLKTLGGQPVKDLDPYRGRLHRRSR